MGSDRVEELLVVTAPYVRPVYDPTGRLHIDPVIRWNYVAYGLSAEQVSIASTVSLPGGRFIKLSKNLPRGSIFVPIRYNKAEQAYMAPVISRIILTLGGQNLAPDVSYDLGMWELEPEVIDALERGANLEECLDILRDKYDLNEEEIKETRSILENARITEEPVKSLLLKALKEEAIGGWHIEQSRGLVVIAETLVCFSEDTSLEPINAPIISREMAAFLFDREKLSLKQYAGYFRSIRGFTGEKARRLLRHLIEQRLPWL